MRVGGVVRGWLLLLLIRLLLLLLLLIRLLRQRIPPLGRAVARHLRWNIPRDARLVRRRRAHGRRAHGRADAVAVLVVGAGRDVVRLLEHALPVVDRGEAGREAAGGARGVSSRRRRLRLVHLGRRPGLRAALLLRVVHGGRSLVAVVLAVLLLLAEEEDDAEDDDGDEGQASDNTADNRTDGGGRAATTTTASTSACCWAWSDGACGGNAGQGGRFVHRKRSDDGVVGGGIQRVCVHHDTGLGGVTSVKRVVVEQGTGVDVGDALRRCGEGAIRPLCQAMASCLETRYESLPKLHQSVG